MRITLSLIILSICFSNFCQEEEAEVILWELNRLDSIGGNPVTLYGEPILVETDSGTAVEFNGINDGMLIGSNPLSDAEEFSIEVIFMPYPGGLEEQRFIHIEQDNDNRALIELRTAPDDSWFLDTFIKSTGTGTTLYADDFPHETNKWWHACLVYRKDTIIHYVNGIKELADEITFQPVSSGATSIGVRQNLVSWYKGIIKTLKVTHKALSPEEFLVHPPLNTPITQVNDLNENFFFKVYPNPLITEATISYSLAAEANVVLKFYNMQFVELADLFSGVQTPGNHTVRFNRENLPAGIYFCVLQIDNSLFNSNILIMD